MLWTVPKGKITTIASRPSHGKSSLCNQLSCVWSEMGRNVALISLEDGKEDYIEKVLCNRFEIDNWQLKVGNTDHIDLMEATEYVSNMKVMMHHNFGYNYKEFKTAILGTQECPMQPKPDVVILDYIQLLEGTNMLSKIAEFMGNVKRFSKEHDMAVVIACQINREGEKDGRPSLRHLKGAGSLEEVSDVVFLLHHFWADKSFNKELKGIGLQDAQELLEINIAKNKTGPRGRTYVRYIGKYYRFYDWRFKDTDLPHQEPIRQYLMGTKFK